MKVAEMPASPNVVCKHCRVQLRLTPANEWVHDPHGDGVGWYAVCCDKWDRDGNLTYFRNPKPSCRFPG